MEFAADAVRGKSFAALKIRIVEPLARRAWRTHQPLSSSSLLAVNGKTRPDKKVGRNIPSAFYIGAQAPFCPELAAKFPRFGNQGSLTGYFSLK
jgi:hypothetical protein